MTNKICDFCGEPIADGLQEHDFATCAHNLRDKVVQLEAENKGMKEGLRNEGKRIIKALEDYAKDLDKLGGNDGQRT